MLQNFSKFVAVPVDNTRSSFRASTALLMITFIATLLQTEHDLAAAEDTTIPGPCSGQLQRIWWPQDFA